MTIIRLYRLFPGLLAGFWIAASAHALSLADISGQDAGGGLKEALTQGAGKAVEMSVEEEKAIRENPVGATGNLARKVFGALK